MAKQLVLTDDEYNSLMTAIKEFLIALDFGPRHEDFSLLYHTLGTNYGYEEDAMNDADFIAAWKRGELHFYYTHDPKILKFLEECSPEWPCEHGTPGGCEED